MHLVDHLFVLLLFVVQPFFSAVEARRIDARVKAGQCVDRFRIYGHTVLLEWLFLAVLAAAWLTLGRPIEDLGFALPRGPGFWVGAALLVLLIGVLLYSWRRAKGLAVTETARELESLGRVVQLVPHNAGELQGFVGVSITAGIVEEIVYRGFVLWYLTHFMPLWFAVIFSSVVFGLGHIYQGANGALRAGLVGLTFGIFYIATGSIWLPIVAHAALDILQGVTIYEMLRKHGRVLRPQAAA
jgi:membrane protease YdiL (CAAX protease family)